MLVGLSIRDVVLIEALDLEIAGGFTALTGETGAGKSILLDALGLALGARSDKGLVRAGAERASAAATFEPPADHPAHVLLEELGLPPAEDGQLVLRRLLSADGKSRAFVNDAPATAQALARLGASLLEVHGQHAAVGLLDAQSHRPLLDRHAGADGLLSETAAAWERLRAARAAQEALRARQADADRERDFLAHAAQELARLAPAPGEEEALAGERQALMAGERLGLSLKEAGEALADGAAEARLTAAARALERATRLSTPESDTPVLAAARAAAEALERALVEAGEARAQIDAAARRFEVDPKRLEAIEERLFALRAAARKHATSVEALPALGARFGADLEALETLDADIAAAARALAQAEATYDAAADALSALRARAASGLADAVMAELPDLRLDKVRLRVSVQPDPARAGPQGRDRVMIEVSTNPGAPFGPLAAIASGGELARLSLALKVALARSGEAATLIFDEVDQGVGGATADAVGRRLARLAQAAQILCVTHSPQVAARARTHWRIEKAASADGSVRTTVVTLAADAREEEIARMLSGAEITPEARAAARKLVGA
jgi:DNA repair protein RecN (Recombination protein N)